MNKHICIYCAVTKELTETPDEAPVKFKTEEELFNHVEEIHDTVISRIGETPQQAHERVLMKNPRIDTDQCRCPRCKMKNGDPREVIAAEMLIHGGKIQIPKGNN